jgi:hypothetical protein
MEVAAMKFKKGFLSLLILFSYKTFFLFSVPEVDDIDVFELDNVVNNGNVVVDIANDDIANDDKYFHFNIQGWCCGEEVISVEKDLLEIHWRETCELLGLKEVPRLEGLKNFKVPRMKTRAVKRLIDLLGDIHKFHVKNGCKEKKLKKIKKYFRSYLLRNPRELQKLLPLFERCLPKEHIEIVANRTELQSLVIASSITMIVSTCWFVSLLRFDSDRPYFEDVFGSSLIVILYIVIYFFWKLKGIDDVCKLINDPSLRYESQPLLGHKEGSESCIII